MFTDAEEVDTNLFGQDALLHHVADRLSMGQRLTVGTAGAISECVEAEHKRERNLLARGGG